MDWVEKAMELKRINKTTLLRWNSNKIVVHAPHWKKYTEVDTWTFQNVMENKFEGAQAL